MRKAIPLMVMLWISISASRAATPLHYTNSQKTDLDIVDHLLHPMGASNSMEMEREILIRGPKPGVVKALCQALTEKDRRAILTASPLLALFQVKKAVPYLTHILQTEESDYLVLSTTLSSLGELGGAQAQKALHAFYRKESKIPFGGDSERLSSESLEALGRCKAVQYKAELKEEAALLTAPGQEPTQIQIYKGLAEMGDPSIRRTILDLLALAKKPKVIGPAVELLGMVGQAQDLPVLRDLQKIPEIADQCEFELKTARFKLEMIGLPEADKAQRLGNLLKAERVQMVLWAVQELTALGTPEALAVLKLHANDPGLSNVQLKILEGLRRNGKTFERIERENSEMLKVR